MPDSEIRSNSTGMRNLLLVASICAILVASLELLSWVFEWQLRVATILRSIPMAPSTAICFILLALMGLLEPRKTSGRVHVMVPMSVIILVMVFCCLDFLESLGVTSFDIEGYLLPESRFLNGVPLGRMSPMTAILFLLSSGAMLLFVIRSMVGQDHRLFGRLSGLLGCVVGFSGFTLVLGYVYGTPLLYNREFIPVAASTALGFVFLSLTVFARLKSDDIPKRYFLDSEVHRQLSRAFVPLVFFAVILQGILGRFAPLLVDINNALLSALLAGIFAVLAVIATSKVISLVGGEIVRTKEALQESEERLRLAQDAAKAGTWEWDLRTNQNFWSEELWTLYGLEPYSCKPSYETWLQTINPDDRAAAEWVVQEAASQGTELNAVWRTRSSNGHERWLMSRGRPICDAKGKVIRYVGIVIDITESKRVEERLRASEERYRAVYENAGIGIDLLDRDGKILQVNQSLLDMLGYSEEELRQLTFLDITHPEEREISKHNLEALMAGEIEFYRLEKRYLRKDGSILWADLTTSAIRGPNGEHSGTIGVISDITDRKEAEKALRASEEKYRLLVDKAQEAIFVLQDTVFRFVNPRLEEIVGYSADELIESSFGRFVHPEDRQTVIEKHYRRLKGEVFPSRYEFRIIDKQNREKWVEIDSVMIDWEGKPAIMVFLTDATYRKLAEEASVQTERLKAIADLSGGVAHHFNNLLQMIMGSASLSLADLESGDPTEVKTTLEKMLEATTRGAEMVKRLQTFANVRADIAKEGATIFDVANTARNVVQVSEPLWKAEPEKNGTKVSLQLDLAEGCLVQGKENEIFEILVNLIRNAVEAMPDGGDIKVQVAGETDEVVIAVRDTGIGIAKDDLPQVFQPFWSSKGVGIGKGMGLAVTHGLVKRHGGTISVQSKVGAGTTFTLRLPLVQEPVPKTEPPSKSNVEASLTILVVEDESHIATLLERILAKAGHRVFKALSGEEGLCVFHKETVDLVICDLGMPGMSGWDVGKAIQSACQERRIAKPPFILLTGWGGQELEKEQIAESGTDVVVAKPIDSAALLATVQEIAARFTSTAHDK